jgi:integrase
VTPAIVALFQNKLKAKGMAAHTVNMKACTLSAMFRQFVLLGMADSNPFRDVGRVRDSEEDERSRGCHDIEKLVGVFEERWDNPLELLLCLIVYSTGMRNSEIKRAKVGDVFSRDGVLFLEVKDSKTKNGRRVIPLHSFVCARLGLDRPPDAPLVELPKSPGELFHAANRTLGYKLGMLPEELDQENITFYSGRHFYKTMLNDGGLGDAEEYFMGHRVSSDVSKLYNHRDRQGRQKLTEAARKVLAILDERLFG